MAAWSQLPNEMKFEVIKRMDTTTRFRFRHVAHSTKILVDSIKFYIPRVYIKGVSSREVHILVYESTQRVSHFKFALGLVYKTTYNPSTATVDDLDKLLKKAPKKVLDLTPIYTSMRALTTITSSNPKTRLGGLDIFGNFDVEGRIELPMALKSCRIRTRIVCYEDRENALPIVLKCTTEDLKEIQMSEIEEELFFWEHEYPQFPEQRKSVRVLYSITPSIHMWYTDYHREREYYDYILNRYEDGDVKQGFPHLSKYPDDKPYFIRYRCGAEEYNLEEQVFSVPCGFFNRRLPREYLYKFPIESCLRRWSCANCTDPFDYWYYNKPRTFIDGRNPVTFTPYTKYEKVFPQLNEERPVKDYVDSMEDEFETWGYRQLVEREEQKKWGRKLIRKMTEHIVPFVLYLIIILLGLCVISIAYFSVSLWI